MSKDRNKLPEFDEQLIQHMTSKPYTGWDPDIDTQYNEVGRPFISPTYRPGGKKSVVVHLAEIAREEAKRDPELLAKLVGNSRMSGLDVCHMLLRHWSSAPLCQYRVRQRSLRI